MKPGPEIFRIAEQAAGARAEDEEMQALRGNYVSMIKDVTPIPHNGCRPPKRRRV